MHKNKFIDLLKKFSAKELRLFSEFVRSPYYNKDQELIKLFESIKTFHPLYVNKKLERAQLYELAFPGKSFDEKQLGYYMSDLMRLGEVFTGIYEISDHPLKLEVHKLDSFSKKDLHKQYNAVLKDIEKLLGKRDYRHSDYYLDEFNIIKTELQNDIRNNRPGNSTKLNRAVSLLDQFYLINKLKYELQLLHRKKRNSNQEKIIPLGPVIQLIETGKEKMSPLLETYFYAYKSLASPESDVTFLKLKNAIKDYMPLIPEEEAREVYLYAINFAVKKINRGDASYEKELFHLYKDGIDTKALLNRNTISVATFKNMISVALRNKSFEWLEEFVIEYKDLLPEAVRNNAYYYSMAVLSYHQQMPDEALTLLNEVGKYDEEFDLGIGSLKLKLHYELSDKKGLDKHKDFFINYLQKSKHLKHSTQSAYLNLIQKALQIYRLPINDFNAIKQLNESLNENKNISEKKWLRLQLKKKTADTMAE